MMTFIITLIRRVTIVDLIRVNRKNFAPLTYNLTRQHDHQVMHQKHDTMTAYLSESLQNRKKKV